MNHTKTPWKVANTHTKRYVVSHDEAQGICSVWSDCGDEQGQANAAHIVKCVNAHDALLAACKHGAASSHHTHCESKRGQPCTCHVGKCQNALATLA